MPSYTQNRKLGNLGKCCFTSNFVSRCKNDKKLTETKLKGQDMLLEEKKRKLPRFPSFRLCPAPKIENSEISESVLLFQILTVVVTFSKFLLGAKSFVLRIIGVDEREGVDKTSDKK